MLHSNVLHTCIFSALSESSDIGALAALLFVVKSIVTQSSDGFSEKKARCDYDLLLRKEVISHKHIFAFLFILVYTSSHIYDAGYRTVRTSDWW